MNEIESVPGTKASTVDGGEHLDALVTSVLSDLLDQDSYAPDDNFFLLGGDSLLAATAARQLSSKTGRSVSAEDVFIHPTARELSAFLRKSAVETS